MSTIISNAKLAAQCLEVMQKSRGNGPMTPKSTAKALAEAPMNLSEHWQTHRTFATLPKIRGVGTAVLRALTLIMEHGSEQAIKLLRKEKEDDRRLRDARAVHSLFYSVTTQAQSRYNPGEESQEPSPWQENAVRILEE